MLRKNIALLLSFLLVFGSFPLAGLAVVEDPLEIAFSVVASSNQIGTENEEVTVDVDFTSNEDLSGISVGLTYDSSLLEFVGSDQPELPVSLLSGEETGTPGNYSAYYMNLGTPITAGTHTYKTLTFKSKGSSGLANISFDVNTTAVTDMDGSEINPSANDVTNATIIVGEATLETVTLAGQSSIHLEVGQAGLDLSTLTISGESNFGTNYDVSGLTPQWIVGDNTVASINTNTLNPVSNGQYETRNTTLKVQLDGITSNTIPVIVEPEAPHVANIQIPSLDNVVLWPQHTYDLSQVQVTGTDQYGAPYEVDMNDVTWESSINKIFSINETTLTANTPGTANLTASIGEVTSNAVALTVQEAPVVPVPVPDKAEGTYYGNAFNVYFTNVEDFDVYYTTDGSTPDENSSLYDSEVGIAISEDTTVKAIAIEPQSGEESPEVAELSYNFNTFGTIQASPDSGTYSTNREVTLSVTPDNPDTYIEYSLDGGDTWVEYNSAINMLDEGTITARIVSELETTVVSDSVPFTYDFDHTYKAIRTAMEGLTKLAVLDDEQFKFCVDTAYEMLYTEVYDLVNFEPLYNRDITKDDLLAILDAANTVIFAGTDSAEEFRNAITQPNYVRLVGFAEDIKDAIPVEIKERLVTANRGLTEEDLLLAAFEIMESGVDFFVMDVADRNIIKDILAGYTVTEEDRARLSKLGINYNNLAIMLDGFTDEEVAMMQSIIEAMSDTYTPAPGISLDSGTYYQAKSVQIIMPDLPGTTKYYVETDPSEEIEEGWLPTQVYYGQTIKLNTGHNYRICAYRTSENRQSNLMVWNYDIKDSFELTAKPAPQDGQVIYNDYNVELSAGLETTIYYTTDGTTPTVDSQKYTEAIELAVPTAGLITHVIKAIAVSDLDGYVSPVSSFTYVLSAVASPVATPETGTYGEALEIVLTSATLDAEIYYTTDGTTPDNTSAKYEEAIVVNMGETKEIRAIAYKDGNYSLEKIFRYEVIAAPSATPEPGTYSEPQKVTLDATEGSVIYYTIDGSTPTTSSTMYLGVIIVNSTTTVKAIAVKNGAASSESSFVYTIDTGSISGKVAKYDGTGIPGIKVMIDGTIRSAVTDKNGEYTITDLLAGNYTVRTLNPLGYVDKSQSVDVTANTIDTNDFELIKGGMIVGSVTDNNENALEGIEVTVSNSSTEGAGNWAQAYTDSDGKYVLEGLQTSNDYKISFRDWSEAYLEEKLENVSVTLGERTNLETVTLESFESQLATLTGTVKDDNGDPVANVYVSVWSESTFSWASDVTDENGTYSLADLLPGADYEIYLWGEQQNLVLADPDQTRNINLAPGATETKDIIVNSGITFSGTVIDKDTGDPIGNVDVSISSPETYGWGWAKTDENGQFTINNVQPADDYEIYTWNNQFYMNLSGVATDDNNIPITDDVADYVIELEKGKSISGLVTDISGNLIEGAGVFAWSTKGGWANITTDADGEFTLRGLGPADDYTINVWKDGYNRKLVDSVNVSNVNVSLGTPIMLLQPDEGVSVFYGNDNTVRVLAPVAAGEQANVRVNYKNVHESFNAENAVFTAQLPLETSYVSGSCSVSEDTLGFDYDEATRVLTVPVDTVNNGNAGFFTFEVLVGNDVDATELPVGVTAESGPNNNRKTDSLGVTVINVISTTIKAPEVAKPGSIILSGRSSSEAKIEIYGKKDNEEFVYLGKTKADGKFWSLEADVELVGTYSYYAIAKIQGKESKQSDVVTVEVSADLPVIEDLRVKAGWNDWISTNPHAGVPAMAASQGHRVEVEVEFSGGIPQNPAMVFDGENYDLTLNQATGKYEGYFDINYVVFGEQEVSLQYGAIGRSETFTLPFIELLILIDPSGYVEDAHSGARISGVKAVCEVWEPADANAANADPNLPGALGSWEFWDAERYGQVNPQLTDDNGKYGWDVPAGHYRVIFSKDGYQTYISRIVSVPPPETELNIGFVSLASVSIPSVVGNTPADNASNVPISTTVTATFSKEMDDTTLTNANFTLKDDANNVIPGTVTMDGEKKVATFTPDAFLANSTTYTASISTDVLDSFGNALPGSVSWSFTTADAITMVTVGTPLSAYAPDADATIFGKLFINGALADAGKAVDLEIKDLTGVSKWTGSATTDDNGDYSVAITTPSVDGFYNIEASYDGGPVFTAQFEVVTVVAPSASVAAGTYTGSQSITLSTVTAGAEIRYTTDGSTPGADSTLYSGAITVSSTKTIKAIALLKGVSSDLATFAYTINYRSSGGGGGGSTPVAEETTETVKPDATSTATLDDGKITVTLPAGAVNVKANVTIKEVSNKDQIAPTQGLIKIGNLQYQIDVEDKVGKAITQFTKDLVFNFNYSSSDIPSGVSEEDLKVCYWDENAGVWIAVPTTVDKENNKVTARTNHLTVYAVMAVADFPALGDIANHWAEIDIMKIVSLNIASGDPTGDFRPNDNISRQEFAKIVVLAAGLTPEANPELTFADADEIATWAKGYVAAAVKAGIINGYEDNTFRARKEISRTELATMIIRALGEEVSVQPELTFYDADNIPAWATGYVAKAVDHQIINGYPDGTFRANEKATRAQSAKMVSKMLDVRFAK